MTHIAGHDRDQMLLLPEVVDDYVTSDNPVRFIDAFVDGLDLAALGFARVTAEVTGRPGYAPGDLLKLYIYGYLNRVRSSRRLEAETHRNLEVIWLLRHLRPDFKTIADFRRDNRAAFRSVFREFVLLCRQLDLFGRELLAVDGTRIKAVNNKNRNFTRASLRQYIAGALKAHLRPRVTPRRVPAVVHARPCRSDDPHGRRQRADAGDDRRIRLTRPRRRRHP
jgi:transposase